MRILVVYYSKTGTTRKVAEKIASTVGAQQEEITEIQGREGTLGRIRSVYQAIFNQFTRIGDLTENPADYDLIIVGSPIWAGRPSTPVTTFLKKYQSSIRRLAVFITHGFEDRNYPDAIHFMEHAAGVKCEKSLSVSKDAVRRAYENDIIRFANEINKLATRG